MEDQPLERMEADYKMMLLKLRFALLFYAIMVCVIFILMQVFWFTLPIDMNSLEGMSFLEFWGQAFRLILLLGTFGCSVYVVCSAAIMIQFQLKR